MAQSLWKTVWRFLRELKIELPYDPLVPHRGIYPDRTIVQKDTCSPVFTAALFTADKAWKHPKCLCTDEWMKEMCFTYTIA